MEVVVEVGACADDEVHQPSLHQLDHAAAKPGRRQGTSYGQRNGRVVLRQEHLIRKNTARLPESRRVERLKSFFNELMDVSASTRPIVANGLSGQVTGS